MTNTFNSDDDQWRCVWACVVGIEQKRGGKNTRRVGGGEYSPTSNRGMSTSCVSVCTFSTPASNKNVTSPMPLPPARRSGRRGYCLRPRPQCIYTPILSMRNFQTSIFWLDLDPINSLDGVGSVGKVYKRKFLNNNQSTKQKEKRKNKNILFSREIKQLNLSKVALQPSQSLQYFLHKYTFLIAPECIARTNETESGPAFLPDPTSNRLFFKSIPDMTPPGKK